MNEYLAGKRVLIVEDNPILAFEMIDLVNDVGGQPIGPAHSLSAALQIARLDALDGALLDIDLGGEQVWPLANELMDQAVPFVFVSAQCTERNFPERFKDQYCVQKPAVGSDILAGLTAAMERPMAPPTIPVRPMSIDGK